MNRQEEALALAVALLKDIELSVTSTAKRVLMAMRLARLLRDEAAQRWLGYEVNGVPNTPDGRSWMTRTRRWTDQAEDKGYWMPAAELDAVRSSSLATAAGLGGSVSLSGDHVSIAMRERSTLIVTVNGQAAAMEKVLAAVDARLHRYAGDVLAELRFSELQASLFAESQTAVDAILAGTGGSALRQIDAVSDRLASDDPEAVSQAMSTCRRLIDSVADHLFPAGDTPYDLNGQPLNVKQNSVLNRLNAHVHAQGVRGGRADRLRRGLADVYGRVSAGVHADVDGHEARYLFLSAYMLLGEMLTLSDAPPP